MTIRGALGILATLPFSRRDRSEGMPVVGQVVDFDRPASDLPCPWCHGPTAEDDSACPTCGQVFGIAATG